MNASQVSSRSHGIDGMTLAGLAFLIFMALMVILDWLSASVDHDITEAALGVKVENSVDEVIHSGEETGSGRAAPEAAVDPTLFAAPYDHYLITQGPHGFSYGHMAIDIAAGKGAEIKSPINGVVTALYIDEWGNPTLVIENDTYQVTLLHGKYTVQVGDEVQIGHVVGKESNQGFTTDLSGRSCWNRDCGYHTHLNVFDKRLGANVNPLDLIGK